jgi:hypothetical protein
MAPARDPLGALAVAALLAAIFTPNSKNVILHIGKGILMFRFGDVDLQIGQVSYLEL